MIITEATYGDTLALRQQVLYPEKDIEFVKLPDDDLGLHIGIEENKELVCVMSLFIEMETKAVQFRKLATRTDMQGKGYASVLMKWLIDYATDMKLNKLWCNARKDAASFYKKFGYKETDQTFERSGHEYVIMELTEFPKK